MGARIAENQEERVPLAPREGELGEVDLRLMTPLRFEAHKRLRGGLRPHLGYVVPEMTDAARIAGNL